MKRAIIVALLPVAGVLLLFGALWAQSRPQVPTVTRTQRIELLDRDGRIRAELKISGEDTLLALYDGLGRLRTLVGTESVVFYSTDGKVQGRIDASALREGK
ncbi:MAG: hypothetical protein ACUVSV_15550 [Armatimonadota bacterium]